MSRNREPRRRPPQGRTNRPPTARAHALAALPHRRRSLDGSSAASRRRRRDSHDTPITVCRNDIRTALEAYQDGRLSCADLTHWVEAVLEHDDIGVEPDAEDIVRDVLFELYTSDESEPPTPDRAAVWIRRLTEEPGR